MLKCRHPVLHFSGYHCITVFKWITLNFPREDIVTKMCRNAIYFPESGDIPTHFAQTIACQGHLAPLPLNTAPVYWDFDRFISFLFMLIFHIYIYFAWLSECFFVCLYLTNLKTAEPIWPTNLVGPHGTPEKVYIWSNFWKEPVSSKTFCNISFNINSSRFYFWT